MKGLKTLVAIALSTAGLGTAVTLGVVAGSEQKIESTHAAATTRLYLDMSQFADWYSASATFKVHTWNSANGDKYFATTKVGDAYYYADVDLSTYANGGGYRFSRFDSGGSSEWNKGAWNSYSSGIKTYYVASDWNESGSWDTNDQLTWSVVGATNGLWAGGDEDINFSLDFRFNDEGLAFYNTTVTLTAGSVFKVKNSNGNYYGYNAIETGSGSVVDAGDVSGSDNSNITVVNSGSYEMYMKPISGKFWMQENSADTATNWAQSFLDATGTICSTGGESADHLSALQGIWADQKSSFEDLTQGARNIIKAGTENTTVADAHDRYVHIMERYSGSLDEFGDWTVSASRMITPLINESNYAIVIVVVGVAAISALGAFLLLRKKRKEQ